MAAAEWAAWYASPANYCKLAAPKETAVTQAMAEGYASTPTGFVGRMRVSLLSVLNAMAPLSACEARWLELQKGQQAYTVSAAMLWARTLDEKGFHPVACRAMRVPLSLWESQNIIELEQIARRSSSMHGGAQGSHVLVARLKTLMGRDLRGHDTSAEIEQRCALGQPHEYGPSQPWPRANWRRDVIAVLQKLLGTALDEHVPSRDQEPSRWAVTRGLWLPAGTSSNKITTADPAGPTLAAARSKGWPYSKKAAWANSQLKLSELLSKQPRIDARGATKNEPGLKRRALRAADDCSYLIAAYASAGLEKTYTEAGAVMRQRPSDVQETTRAVANNKDHILCVDYSDFNLTHQVSIRAAMSQVLADIYRNKGMPHAADAATWMRDAHFNHHIDGHRVLRGLSSGERDTARDNTVLHTAYATIAMLAQGAAGQRLQQGFFRCCGDDEILVGVRWPDAVGYVLELEAQGHAIQHRKIMLSQHTGEFLQYNMFTDARMPTQPICPALINAVSGSWYKSSRYDPASVPQQAADAFSALARRGLNQLTAKKLTISCCNWLVPQMPWRRMLNAHHFFASTTLKPDTNTATTLADVRAACIPTSVAARDYCTWLQTRYPTLFTALPAIGAQVIGAIDLDIYGAAVAALKTTPADAVQAEDDISVGSVDRPFPTETGALARAWLAADGARRVDQFEALAFATGLPVSLLKGPTLTQVVKALRNEDLAKVAIEHNRPLPMKGAMRFMLPGAIVSYF
jgi:hypothetical protein